MRPEHEHTPAALRSSPRRNPRRLGFSCACAALIAAVALAPLGGSAAASPDAQRRGAAPKAKTQASNGQLSKKQIIALIKKYADSGPQGVEGAQGSQGPQGAPGKDGTNAIAGPPTGPAGGDLSGTYPNPQLAAGTVGSANFAPGAVAPEAELFGGLLPAAFQQRVTGTCAAGQAIRLIDAAGTVTCGTTAPSGSAGGALAGNYPNPELNVSGGDAGVAACKNGEALTGLSSASALTCDTGVYVNGTNFAVAPNPFPSLTTGSYNSALGGSALSSNTTGYSNSAVGHNALAANLNGVANSALGEDALSSNTSGIKNVAIGDISLQDNTSGEGNTAVGHETLRANNANENTAVGESSLQENTSGTNNAALGGGALNVNTTGSQNTALGTIAMSDNLNGQGNTVVGFDALQNNTTGNDNAVLGNSAMEGINGSNNVAVGAAAGNNTAGPDTGSGNVAIGQGAGNSGAAGDTGSNNVAVGFLAGFHYPAGRGANNIALGYSAGGHAGTLANNNIDIGNTGFPNDNNTIRIGAGQFQPNPQHTRAFIAGITGVTTGGPSNPVVIDGTGQLGTAAPSARRYKEDIRPLRWLSDPIMRLKPVSFRYRSDPSSLQYGLIAEQVANVMPRLAIMDEQGRPESVRYQDLPVLLLSKVQQQQRTLRRQHHQNAALRAQNRTQQAQIDWLMHQMRGR